MIHESDLAHSSYYTYMTIKILCFVKKETELSQ